MHVFRFLSDEMEIIALIKHIIQGVSVGFMASVPLGPIGVLCIQRTLSRGRMSGFASGLGAASSDLIYAIVAGFSVSMVMEFVKSQEQMLTLLGALVLVGLGLKIFFSNPIKQMRNQRVTPRRSSGLWQDYISTFLLTIANPLAIFLFVAGFSLVGGGDGIIGRVALLCGVFVGAAAWWFILTMLVGLFRKKLTLKRLYYLNKIAGAVIIILAIGALLYKLFFQILF